MSDIDEYERSSVAPRPAHETMETRGDIGMSDNITAQRDDGAATAQNEQLTLLGRPGVSSQPRLPRPARNVRNQGDASMPPADAAHVTLTPNAPREKAAAPDAARQAPEIGHDDLTYRDLPTPPLTPWQGAAPHAAPLPPQPPADADQPQPGQGRSPAYPARPSPGPTRAQTPQPTHAPWQASPTWGPTTLNIEANTAAGASYLFWWISGLLVYFNERNNRFVRFHAMQSILLTGVFTVAAVFASVFSALCYDIATRLGLSVFHALGNAIAVLVAVLIVFLWLGVMIAAWSGHYLRFPLIGRYAERYAAPPLQPPARFF